MAQSINNGERDETLIVIPCFNEALRLRSEEFVAFLDQTANVTLMFVDDGSTDDTPLVLEQMRRRCPRQVCTLRLDKNMGKAEAVRQGIQVGLQRRPALIGYWDADLATPLNAIPRFVDLLQTRQELKLVMGSRVALLGRRIRRSPWRHLAGRAFATCASFALGLPVYDTQCGAKLFRVTPSTRELFSQPYESRWVFDVEILARMLAADRNETNRPNCNSIYECPLEEWQDIAGSRLRMSDFLVAAADLVTIYWSYRRPRRWSAVSLPLMEKRLSNRMPQARKAA